MPGIGGYGFGRKTAAADTRIRRLLPPNKNNITRLNKLAYTCGATAHTLTVARTIGRTVAAAAALSGQPVIVLAADPNPAGNALAANDLLAIRELDGVTRLYTVQSLAGLTVTLATNLAAGVSGPNNLQSGGTVWSFGLLTDTDPKTGEAHPTLSTTANATVTYFEGDAGVIAGTAVDQPLLIDSDNSTNAGVLEQSTFSSTVE